MHFVCLPKFRISIVFIFHGKTAIPSRNDKHRLWKTLGGKRGVLWEMCKWPIKKLEIQNDLMVEVWFKFQQCSTLLITSSFSCFFFPFDFTITCIFTLFYFLNFKHILIHRSYLISWFPLFTRVFNWGWCTIYQVNSKSRVTSPKNTTMIPSSKTIIL